MDILNEEFLRLIKALNDNNVQYLVVGGLAVNQYGFNRSSADVDFWLKDDIDNRKNLVKTFYDLEYGNFHELMTTPFLPGFCEIYLDSGIYAVLLSEIHGCPQEPFEACFARGIAIHFKDVEMRFTRYDDLIFSQGQSARSIHIQDLKEVKKLRNL